MYLQSLKQFRGIAIVVIVAGHCVYASGWAVSTVTEKWIANLVVGGTSLFVFISGFLFHHLHASRFDYRRFLTKKVQKVLIPYLVLATPLILYRVLIEGSQAENASVAHYLLTGKVLTGYWYIPFICVVFALSPLVILLFQLAPRIRLAIVGLCFLASLAMQRPVGNLAVWQSVAYFLPVFLIGALASLHRPTILARLKGREPFIALLIGALAGIQAYAYPSFGNLHKPAFQLGLPDILLAQKILLCLFFMVLLHRFEDRPSPTLGLLASASFPIFFLHPWVIWGAEAALNSLGSPVATGQGPLLWLVMTPAVVLISLGMALVVRHVFTQQIGRLIGW